MSDETPVWRIIIVMCPNDSCLHDLQVGFEDDEDGSTVRRCPHCETRFWVSLPSATE